MATVAFKLNCIPPKTTAQQKRLVVVDGKPRFFKKKEQTEAESLLTSLLREHVPPRPMKAPVAITICIRWPYTKATPKRVVEAGEPVPHTTRPDMDNWAKGFIDLLASMRFIEDDAHVTSLLLEKERGNSPGIYVKIEERAGRGKER